MLFQSSSLIISLTCFRYESTFHCQGVKLSKANDLYARYTTTVVCNALVQMSISDCNLSSENSRPVCADTCAEYAQSEVYFTSDDDFCSKPSSDLSDLIRADFITCSLPKGALESTCITGGDNEPNNCGYGNSTVGLCSYCAEGGTNSTDTCCYNAGAESKCKNVHLPTITSTMIFTAPTQSSTSTSGSTSSGSAVKTSSAQGATGSSSPDSDQGDSNHHHGLSGGAIAGIVIGSIVGVILIALLLFLCVRILRRRSTASQKDSILNQPSPARRGPTMSQTVQEPPSGYEVLPGGRIARMSALEGHSGDSPTHHHGASFASGAAGFGAGYGAGKTRGVDTQSSSDEQYDSPSSGNAPLRPPPMNPRRQGSLSSNSALGAGSAPQSPVSAGQSSPQGINSQQSEQLPFFKDYYSQDDIHPSDRVAVLWAYQPRAADEFGLERGDMLKVVGIWDDGWATGVMLDERAENWEARRAQRDSGVSNAEAIQDPSPVASGEIKAFPLVCVCLPEHWKKTIDGDTSTDSGTNAGLTATS